MRAALLVLAYLVIASVIALAVGARLRELREAQERLAQYKKRALGL